MFKHPPQIQHLPQMRVRIALCVLTGLMMGGTWASLSRAALGQDSKSVAVKTSQLSLAKGHSIRAGAGQKAAHQPLLQFGSEGEDVQRAQTLLQLQIGRASCRERV